MAGNDGSGYSRDFDLDGNGVIGGSYLGDDRDLSQQKIANPQKLDSTQHDPSKLKSITFKQDYTVLIRKKKYYAISQQSDELYVKVYQVNNFTNISLNHKVGGSVGTCKITMKGGERVIAADKQKVKDTDWKSFEHIKQGWNNIDNEKLDKVDGIEYKDAMIAREHKYYWKYAEKADWEPMDEIYVFAKSRFSGNQYGTTSTTGYKFVQVFFGYITTVNKSFSAQGGPIITIDAEDHLKLLRLSRMSMRPPFDMSVGGVGVRYDGFGNMIVEDNPKELINTFQNFFAGAEVHNIIRNCALGAGIPAKYLQDRIEDVRRVPFVPQIAGGTSFAELFKSDWQTRLGFCQQAAEKLNLEFFADETGQIVLKIPSYAVGINKKPKNYEGDPGTIGKEGPVNVDVSSADKFYQEIQDAIKSGKKEFNVIYTIQPGDTLSIISKRFYGTSSKWKLIYDLNAGIIGKDYNTIKHVSQLVIKLFVPNIDLAINAYKEMKKKENQKTNKPQSTIANDSKAARNDHLIRIIKPHEIIAFSLTDSDSEIFTAAQVSVEYSLLDASMKQLPPAITRAVQDFDLIRQFGFRLISNINTPIVGGPTGAANYAGLIILRSLSWRFTGSLTMIEEAGIRVGDPIRFHSYDEHPFTEMLDPEIDPAQSIYYVESVTRNINPAGISTMTLGLKAGRVYGQPSIYDNCQELYRYFYEDDDWLEGQATRQAARDVIAANNKGVSTNKTNTNEAKDKNQQAKSEELKKDVKSTATKKYRVKAGDSLSKIAGQFYGDQTKWRIIYNANRGNIAKPDLLKIGQEIIIPPL